LASLRVFASITALGLLILLACAPSARRGAGELSRVSLPQLLDDIERNQGKLRTLKGRARISFESPTAGYAGYTEIAVRRPDSALIKVEAVFGLDVGSLFIDGQSFAVYIPSERRVYKGSIERLRYLDPLATSIDAQVLISALTGLWPLPRVGVDIKGADGDALLIESHEAEGIGSNLDAASSPEWNMKMRTSVCSIASPSAALPKPLAWCYRKW